MCSVCLVEARFNCDTEMLQCTPEYHIRYSKYTLSVAWIYTYTRYCASVRYVEGVIMCGASKLCELLYYARVQPSPTVHNCSNVQTVDALDGVEWVATGTMKRQINS